MKFTVLQQDLLPYLQAVSRSVGSKSTLPVLDNILLATEGSVLKIAATNLEIGVIKYIPVEVLDAGEVTVPAKTIVDIVSGLKQERIEIESDSTNITITSGKFKAKISGIPSNEFPVIPLSSNKGVSFDKETLQSCSQILFASAVDEGRPILTGILTQTNGEWLDFVATDGFRLAHRRVKLNDNTTSFKSLIPRKTYEEMLKVLSEDQSSEISISTSDNQNQAIFNCGSTVISSRLIEGTFPSWEKIIPTNIVSKAKVVKDELLKAVKLAAVFARNESNVVIIKTRQNKLLIESSAKELGSQENEIEGEVGGEEIQIAFNAKFLLDAINNCPSTDIQMQFSGSLSPTLIKPNDDLGLEYIVMPVRLN